MNLKPKWLAQWQLARQIKKLRARFRVQADLCSLAAKNQNERGHQLALLNMREIYKEMRATDPNCPAWKDTRNERRMELKARQKRYKRQQPKHGPRLKSTKAKQTQLTGK